MIGTVAALASAVGLMISKSEDIKDDFQFFKDSPTVQVLPGHRRNTPIINRYRVQDTCHIEVTSQNTEFSEQHKNYYINMCDSTAYLETVTERRRSNSVDRSESFPLNDLPKPILQRADSLHQAKKALKL